MVHPALPGEAKIAFGKVNGTFASGLLHKREGGKLSEKQPQLLASVLEAGQRPRDRALALPILISVLSFQGLSHLASLSSSSSLLSHPPRESHFCLSFPSHRYSIFLLPFQRIEWAERSAPHRGKT